MRLLLGIIAFHAGAAAAWLILKTPAKRSIRTWSWQNLQDPSPLPRPALAPRHSSSASRASRGARGMAVVRRAAAAGIDGLRPPRDLNDRRVQRSGGPSTRLGRAWRAPGSRGGPGGTHRARGAPPVALLAAAAASRRVLASRETPAKQGNRNEPSSRKFPGLRPPLRRPGLDTWPPELTALGELGGRPCRGVPPPPGRPI